MAYTTGDESAMILDEDGSQVLDGLVIIDVEPTTSMTYPTHTLEDKSVVTDDAYENQDKVSIKGICDPDSYVETYETLQKYKTNMTNLSVQSKVGIFDNMYIISLSHKENASMYGTVAVTIQLQEQIIKTASTTTLSTSDVSSTSDSSTVSGGTKTTSSDDGTLLSNTYDSIFG